MDFNIEQHIEHTLVKVLHNKLDVNVSISLKSELVIIVGNGEKNVILDISKCIYCDSSGLSAMLLANRLCKAAGGTFYLTGLNSSVQRLIEISQLDTIIKITENIEEAVSLIENR